MKDVRTDMMTPALWAIDSTTFFDAYAGVELPAEALAADSLREAAAKAKPDIRQDYRGVAVIEVSGPLRPNPGFQRLLEVYFGLPISATYGDIRQEVRKATTDDNVKATILRISSPGGSVFGVSELADEIFSARQRGSRVVSYAQDIAASAAYWLGSQASEFSANAVAHVGSIGVFAVVADTSELYKGFGVKVHAIKSAAGKATIIDGMEITEEAKAGLKRTIDETAAVFVDSVARGRGIDRAVAEQLHDGEVYVGENAKALGLIDRVIPFEEALRSEVAKAAARKAAATRARLA